MRCSHSPALGLSSPWLRLRPRSNCVCTRTIRLLLPGLQPPRPCCTKLPRLMGCNLAGFTMLHSSMCGNALRMSVLTLLAVMLALVGCVLGRTVSSPTPAACWLTFGSSVLLPHVSTRLFCLYRLYSCWLKSSIGRCDETQLRIT